MLFSEPVGLQARSKRGVLILMGAQFVKAMITAATLFSLARLLLPDDFGLVAMVTAFTAALESIKDGGMNVAIVQRPTLTRGQASTLFWLSVGFSIAMALIAAASAPLLSWFYQEPRLQGIVLVVAVSLFFGAVGMPQQGIIRRQMRFATLATILIASSAIASLAAMAAAWHGLGYWAIALQLLLQSLSSAILSWQLCNWRPNLTFNAHEVRASLLCGGNLTGFLLVNFFARNLDNILIGRFYGPIALGIYSQAYSLIMMPLQLINSPIGNVATAALSRLQQTPEAFRECYLRHLTQVAALTMPLAAFMIVLAEPIVLTVLGDKWIAAVPLFRILSVCTFFQPIVNTTSWIYHSLGRTGRMFLFAIVSTTLTAVAFLLGLPFGSEGVAIAYTIYVVLHTIPSFLVAFWRTPARLSDALRAVTIPAIASAICAIVLAAIVHNVHAAPLVQVAISAVVLLLSVGAAFAAISRWDRYLHVPPMNLSMLDEPGDVDSTSLAVELGRS